MSARRRLPLRFSSKRRPSAHRCRSQGTRHRRFTIEPLEARTLLSATVWVDDDFNSSTPGWGVDYFATIQNGITAADTDGTVNVAAGTYHESLTVNKDLKVQSSEGAAATIVDASGLSSRVLHVVNNANVEIVSMTLTGGVAFGLGGGVLNDGYGMLTVTDSVIQGNAVSGLPRLDAGGGGIASLGLLMIQGSTLTGNIAQGGADAGSGAGSGLGGAIYVGGEAAWLSIADSVISNNQARRGGAASGQGTGSGGGAWVGSYSAAQISNTTISSNLADDDGGGIYNAGHLEIMRGTLIQQNQAGHDGGGIYTHGYEGFAATLRISDSTIDGNTSVNNGGGIFNDRDHVELLRSTVSANSAVNGGGIYTQSGIQGPQSLDVRETTIANNVASADGGGIYSNTDYVHVENSTLSGNQANRHGGGIYAGGPGEWPVQAVDVTHATIAGNLADADNSGIGNGGGLYFVPAIIGSLRSTIVAANDTRGGAHDDISGSVDTFSSSNNLVGDGTGLTADLMGIILTDGVNGNIVGSAASPIDPVLGLLQDYGGPTFTRALLENSPAIDAGGVLPGIGFDQRGHLRPAGLENDMGAFETGVALDYGDAPDPIYPTLLANNGARHVLGGGLFLGWSVDADPYGGLPSPIANGDDTNGSPDENGVWFTAPELVPGLQANVMVTASAPGLLNAWIDFGQDGSWDPDDQIFTDVSLPTQQPFLTFDVPSDATPGPTFARFRLSSVGRLAPTGLAPDGEVEDYLVTVSGPQFDFGDAPDSYFTTLASDGARHTLGGPVLGFSVDGEPGAALPLDGTGDNVTDVWDEDGVSLWNPLTWKSFELAAGQPATAGFGVSGADGLLDAWIDFNGNGVFDEPADRIATRAPMTIGYHVLDFTVPATTAAGTTFARFRISAAGGLGPSGLAPTGEVEDYGLTIVRLLPDLGDAPESYGTLRTSALNPNPGPEHAHSLLYLGNWIDGESDGQPSANAGDDDSNPAIPDDEDGVTLSSFPVGLTGGVSVQASRDGVFNGWFDFNANGNFDDAGEHIFNDTPVSAGWSVLNFLVPGGAAASEEGTLTYARFRLAETAIAVDTPYGPGGNGEVEDYAVLMFQPVMPDDTTPQGDLQFVVISPQRRAYDPAIAVGYDYEVAGTTFDTVELPVKGDNVYTLHVDPDGIAGAQDFPATATATLNGGVVYDFTAGFTDALGNAIPAMPSVDRFRILGIETSAGVDPANPAAFATILSFAAGGGTLTMTGLPETVYVDNVSDPTIIGGFAGDYQVTNDQGVIGVLDAGDTVTWQPGTPAQITGLIYGSTAFNSIQGAVDGAVTGVTTTVSVAPGTYDLTGFPSAAAAVDIYKPLAVQAADYVDGTPDNTTTILQGVDNKPIDLRITEGNVTIEGFTLDFNGAGTRNIGGIEPNGDPNLQDIQILNNIIDLPDGDPDFAFGEYGFRTGGTNDHSGLLIQGNHFRASGDHGGFALFLNPDSSAGTKTVQDNVFSGKLIQGVMIDKMNHVLVDGNTLDTDLATASYNHPKMIGVNAWGGTISDVTVSRNLIGTGALGLGGGVGITVGSASVASTITGVSVTNNTVRDTYVAGIQNRNAPDVVYSGNILTANAKGIEILGAASTGVAIGNNSIAGNTAGVDNSSGNAIDASGNWWGHSTGPSGAYAGSGDSVSSSVDFTPWLADGTDTDPLTAGFQGDLSDLRVDDDSPQTGAAARIAEGLTLLSSPGTLHVLGGSYAEGVSTAGKTVTLHAGASPAQVTVTGLTLDGNDTLAVDLNGPTAGTEYDQFVVNGEVALGSATLSVTIGGTINDGDAFVLVANNEAEEVSGTFAGLDEGTVLTSGNSGWTSTKTARITYQGGTGGNDVVIVVDGPFEPPAPPPDGNPDTIELHVNGDFLEYLVNGDVVDRRPLASVESITINGSTDSDHLTLDFSGGNPIPAGGLTFNGGDGAGTDSLSLIGGTTTTVTHTFTSDSAGSIALSGPLAGTINYTGLEPVADNLDAVNRVFTFTGGAETITLADSGGADGNMTIDSTLGESVTFANPTASLTINAGTGDDTVTVSSVDAGLGASLAINGDGGSDTVNFTGDITFAAGRSLDVDLTNDAAPGDADAINVGADANLILSGTGTATIKASKNVSLASGASINVADGALILAANGAPAGNYVAIDLNGATLTTSGAGNIGLTGKSGGLAGTSGNVGIRLRSGAVVQSSGAGTITLEGTGGTGTSNNYGVNVDGSGSKVTSATGDIAITGVGGDGSDAFNVGIMLYPGGQVISTGSAKVSLDGTGGAGTLANYGVDLESSAKVSSVDGDISVLGQGGAGVGNYNVGVDLYASSQITATGSAKITITGTGGTGTDDNYGVRVTNSSIASATGDIQVNGTATDATGSNQHGIWFDSSSLTTTGAASVTLTGTAGNAGFGIDLVNSTSMSLAGASNTLVADSMNLAVPASAINAGVNAIAIRQNTPGTSIDLGGADAASTLGLTDGELDCIAAATINIGNTGSGLIAVSAAITRSASTVLNLTTGGSIALSGPGSIDSAGGNVTLTTGGAGAITSGAAAADIVAGAGTVSLIAGSGGIGATGNPLVIGGANLAATSDDANQFLSASGVISIDAADLNAGTGTIELDGGTFLTTPTGSILSPVVVENGATLGGTGTVSATVTVKSGGTAAPGTSPGILSTGDAAFELGSTFRVEINGPSAGEGAGFHDQLSVTGTVSLGSATLDVSTLAPYSPPDEQVFVIIANDGDGTTGDAVVGTFAGLDDGAWILSGSQLYKISYHGNDGNDVTLMAVDTLGQYAGQVIAFSSQYSPTAWSAEQALWAPNVSVYRDDRNAWAPLPRNGTTESITLGYATPVFATGFSIRETYGNGFVTKVEFRDTAGEFYTVWSGVDPTVPGTPPAPADFAQFFLPTSYLADAIRITVDTDHNLSTWEEIDAVELFGVPVKDGIVVTPTTGLTTTEAGATATFTVVLSKVPTANVTVGLSSTDETEGIVLLPSPPTLTFTPANWNVPQTVTVKGVFDLMTDGNVPYTIVTAPAESTDWNFDGVDAADVSVTNLDNWVQEYASSVIGFSSQFSSTSWSAAQALGEPDVTAYRDDPHAWAPHSADGGAEFLTLGFTTPLYATGVVIRESFGNGFVTNVEVRDPAGQFHSVWSGADPTVPGAPPAPADFAISFDETSYLVDAVRITIDTLHSSSWEEIDAVGLLGTPSAGRVVVEPTSGLVTTEAGGTAQFSVVLDAPPTQPVTIGLASSDTTEGTVLLPNPATLTFTPANWNVPQTVTVKGVDDGDSDGSMAYTIITGATVSTDPTFNGLDVPDVSVTNLDNEAAPLGQYASRVIGFSSQYSGDRWSAAQALDAPNAAYRDDPNAWAPSPMNRTTEWLTLGFATPVYATGIKIWESFGNGFVTNVEVRQAGTDLFESVWSGTDPTLPGAVAVFTVPFAQRSYLVDAVRITVDTNHSVNGWEEIDAVKLEGTQSAAQVIVSPTSGLVTMEAGGTATFTVQLSTQPAADVTIGLSSGDGTEGAVSPTTLAFTSDNWNTPQTVTVTGVDDAVVDGDQAYTIVTAAAVSADSNFNGVNAADVSVTNLDNDILPKPTQYATSVIGFSSQYSSTSWSAEQALGAPNAAYRDDPNAWAPLPRNGTTEWLTVGFDAAVTAEGVVIRESWGNGFVTKVEVREYGTETFHEVWSGVDPTLPGAPTDFAVYFGPTAYLVDAVRITVDTNHSGGWEEIDAVQLLDDPSGSILLAPLGDQVVDEQGTLSFSASAAGQVPPAPAMTYGLRAASQALRQDPSVPTLTYSLDAASYALGMRIDPATGAFRWTPARGQAGRYSATIMVRDDVSDPSHPLASETIAITVGDVVNLPSGKIGGLVLRRNGDNLELVGAGNSKTYWTAPAEEVFRLTIRGRANAADTLTVDYTNGPLDIEHGMVFDAKSGGAADTLVIKGTPGSDDTVEIAAGRVVFNGTQYTLRGVENVTVDTGRGDDTVAIAGLGANVTWIDSVGTDRLNFSQAAGSLNLNLAAAARQRILAGNPRTLTLRTIVENVIGTSQADLIKGNKAANRIDGGGGNDTLYGNAGNDVLSGGDGDDWLYGEAGEDTLVGEAGNNVLLGGDGNDVLDAVTGVRTDVAGKNVLIGGKGADAFQGGIGEELLIGGTTNYDNNARALAAVMRAWATDKTFEQRCSLLERGFTDPTAGFIQVKQRSKASPKGTVLDDAARDLLYGRSDPDWFFGFGNDETDRGALDR